MAQPGNFGINVADELTRMNRAASRAKLGAVAVDVIAAINALRADNLALRTKLDADAGVTDTNYVSTAALPAVVKAIDKR